MSKKTIFICDSKDSIELECYVNADNRIYIAIEDKSVDHWYGLECVVLDKETAKEFADHLLEQINLLENE